MYTFSNRKELNKANNGEWRGFRTKTSAATEWGLNQGENETRKVLWTELFTYS